MPIVYLNNNLSIIMNFNRNEKKQKSNKKCYYSAVRKTRTYPNGKLELTKNHDDMVSPQYSLSFYISRILLSDNCVLTELIYVLIFFEILVNNILSLSSLGLILCNFIISQSLCF